jgi:hypothetical protein
MATETFRFTGEAIAEQAPMTGKGRRRTYTLRYEEDALGLPKRIEFEAESPAAALEIAMGEAEGRRALLLADGEPLCQLVKAAADPAPYWIVAPDNSHNNPVGGTAR